MSFNKGRINSEEDDDEFLDSMEVDAEPSNFDIEVNVACGSPATISWMVQALYDTRHSLCFKLKAPEGAYMLLEASEVLDSVLLLVDDEDGEAHFEIEDIDGNVLSASSDQVEAHLAYIVSTESRKRHLTQDLQSSLRYDGRKRRKFHGPFTSTWRKFSGRLKVCRTT